MTTVRECPECFNIFPNHKMGCSSWYQPLTSDFIKDAEEAFRTLSSIWYNGGWVAQTYNERKLEDLMRRWGYWPHVPEEGDIPHEVLERLQCELAHADGTVFADKGEGSQSRILRDYTEGVHLPFKMDWDKSDGAV